MAYNQNNSQKNNNDEVYFDLMEHVGVLANRENGWAKEVNIVAWNGGKPKVDIRDWDPAHERMTKGITLFEEEAEKLVKVLARRYGLRYTGTAQSKTFRRVEHTEQSDDTGRAGNTERAYEAGRAGNTEQAYDAGCAGNTERAERLECAEEIPFEDASDQLDKNGVSEEMSAAEDLTTDAAAAMAMAAIPPASEASSMAAPA